MFIPFLIFTTIVMLAYSSTPWVLEQINKQNCSNNILMALECWLQLISGFIFLSWLSPYAVRWYQRSRKCTMAENCTLVSPRENINLIYMPKIYISWLIKDKVLLFSSTKLLANFQLSFLPYAWIIVNTDLLHVAIKLDLLTLNLPHNSP